MTDTDSAPPVDETTAPPPKPKSRRGFAAMSPEKQREIAALGGKAAHAKGTAHEFSREEAQAAGSRGGKVAQANREARKSKSGA